MSGALAVALEAPSWVSPYARAADRLTAAGYRPIPLMAGTKIPGAWQGSPEHGHWVLMSQWNDFARREPAPAMIERWKTWKDANVGIVLGTPCGALVLVALDFDTDDSDELQLLQSQVPVSRMQKRGARGYTAFYRASPSVKTKRYMVPAPTADKLNAKRCVLEILTGNAPRQTVMPPSRHPDGLDYTFQTGDEIVAIDDLPVLNDDHFEQLEDTMQHLGWEAEAPRRDPAHANDNQDESTVARDLNDRALANLQAWVPALGLYRQRPKQHGYEAVPTWRPSNNGNPDANRKLSLSIVEKGIVDFGADEKYTPIGLVMAALALRYSEAYEWLAALVPSKSWDIACGVNPVAVAAAAARRDAWLKQQAVGPLERGALIDAGDGRFADPETGEIVGTRVRQVWDDREANAAKAVSWLLKGLLPAKGVSLLWGQTGSGKSFVSLDMAASIVTGQDFFGQRVKAPGGVLFALGEASGAMPLRTNAIRTGRFGGVAPNHPVTGDALDLDRLPIAWMPVNDLCQPAAFAAFANDVRRTAADMQAKHGLPLRMLVVDTVVASFGFEEDPDASKVTKAMRALDGLAQELDLLVLAIHHAGKSKEAGEHGSYAWRGSAETSISVDCEKHPQLGTTKNHRLILVKNRHAGNEGWNRPFELKSVSLGQDEDGDEIESAIVVAADGSGDAGAPAGLTCSSAVVSGQRRFLAALATVFEGTARPVEMGGDYVQACKLADVKIEYLANGGGGSPDSIRRRYHRDLAASMEAGKIAIVDDADGENYVFPTTHQESQAMH